MTLNEQEQRELINRCVLVTVDNPYVVLPQDERASEYFGRLISLKSRGYGPPSFPATYLTLESCDFVCLHHTICIQNDQKKLTPLAGFRQISLRRCDYYRVTPPYYGAVRLAEDRIHISAMERLFNAHRQSGQDLLLASGFTIEPSLRGGVFSDFTKEIVAAFMVDDSITHGNAPMIGAGIFRFKTEKLWSKIGFEKMTYEGEVLPPTSLKSAQDDPIVLMQADRFSPWATDCYAKHRKYFETRIIYANNERPAQLAA